MKKIILMLAVIALSATSYVHAGNIPTTLADGTTPFSFKGSNNVSITYYADTDPAQAYVANTKHTSGDRVNSSSNNTSNIWYQKVEVTSAIADSEMTTPGESTYSGWTAQ